MDREEVRQIDISVRASGVAEAIGLINRLITAEEGLVVVTDKIERSDKSLERSLGSIENRYVKNSALIKQVTGDLNKLHDSKARGLIQDREYVATLAAMEAKLKSVAAAQGIVVEKARGWAALSASPTGSYAPMMAQVKAAEDRAKALQQTEQRLRSINTVAATTSGRPERDPNRSRNYATSQALTQGFDILPQVAAGVNPLTILIQQGPQVAQSWAMAGMSVTEGLKDIGARVLGVVTPVRALTAAVAGLGVAAVLAYDSWLSQQQALEASLGGIGRGTGLTARGLNDIAVANAEAGQISNATARELAGIYASTGKIGSGVMASLITVTRDFASTMRQEVPEAAAELAKAFADPAKGMDLLNSKLGFLDAKTKSTIEGLLRARDAEGAQRALYEAMVTGVDKASDRLTVLGRVWQSAKDTISNGWTGLFERPSQQAELETLAARRRQLEDMRSSWSFQGSGIDVSDEINQIDAREAALRKSIQDAERKATELKANQLSLEAADAAKRYLPDRGVLNDMLADQKRLQDALEATRQKGGDVAEEIARLEAALRGTSAAIANFKTPEQLAQQGFGFDMRAITARTAAERAQLARERAEAEALRTPGRAADAGAAGERASALEYARAREDDKRFRDQQSEDRRRALAEQQAELAGIGQTAQAQDQLRKEIELTAEARRRAYELTGDFNAADLSGVRQQAAEWAKLQQQIREAGRARDAMRESTLLGMDPDEAKIRSQFELDAKGEIISANDRIIAQQLRQNEAVRDMQQAFRGVGEELIGAWRKGESGLDVLLNRVQSAADQRLGKMIDNGINSVIDQAMGGLVPGIGNIANPTTSVATMSVQAASVMINGGVGVPGLLGAGGGGVAAGPLGQILRSPVPQIPGTTANDNYMPSHVGLTAGSAARAAAAGIPHAPTANVAGFNPVFSDRLKDFLAAAPDNGISVYSGYRSPEKQAALYQAALAKYGSPEAARRWVAPPGRSMHGFGEAADLRFSSPEARSWAHENAGAYGLRFPMGHEPWHVEPIGGRRMGGVLGQQSAVPPPVNTAQLQQSLATLQTSTQQAAAAIPTMTQGASAAAPALGGVAQQAGGLGGVFQQLLGLGGAPGAAGGGGGILGSIFSLFTGGAGGFSAGGYTGPVGVGQVAGYVHGQEFVAHAEATRRWRPQLEAMNRGQDLRTMLPPPAPVMIPSAPAAAPLQVVVNNNAGAKVEAREEDDGRGNRRLVVQVDEQVSNAMKSGPQTRDAMAGYGGRQKVVRR